MEKFILADAVMQATHMRKFQKQSMHIKKYQMSSYTSKPNTRSKSSQTLTSRSRTLFTKGNSSLKNHQHTQSKNVNPTTEAEIAKERAKDEAKKKLKNDENKQNNVGQENRQKDIFSKTVNSELAVYNNKCILLEKQKKYTQVCCKFPKKALMNLDEFFLKRQIQPKPKSAYQCNSSRALTSARKNRIQEFTFFYDYNLDFIKQRQQNCLILPESTKAPKKQQKIEDEKKLGIKQIVKKQIEEQKRKRKVECKTASSAVRHKASIARQTKKIEEQIRIRDIQEPSYHPKTATYTYKHSTGLSIHKSILPLSKEEIKEKSMCIMDKYKVDMNKYFYKLYGQC